MKRNKVVITVEIEMTTPTGQVNGYPRTSDGWTVPTVMRNLSDALKDELLKGAEDGSAWAWGTSGPGVTNDDFAVTAVRAKGWRSK